MNNITYIRVLPDGKIIGSGSAYVESIAVIPAMYPDATIHEVNETYEPSEVYFEGGVVKNKGNTPSSEHVFNYTTKQWEDPRTLQDFKDAQWVSIKQAREGAINAPLVTPYGTFDSDAPARTSITDAVLMLQTLASMGTPTTIDFTLANNSVVVLDTTQIVTVGLLLGQKTQTAYARARVCRESIDSATTIEEIVAVIW